MYIHTVALYIYTLNSESEYTVHTCMYMYALVYVYIFTVFPTDILDQYIVKCSVCFECGSEINWDSWCVLPLKLIA